MSEHWKDIQAISNISDMHIAGALLPRVNYENLLEDSIYLLPSISVDGFILYDPLGGQVMEISGAQAALLKSRAEDPVSLRKLLAALLGGSETAYVRDMACTPAEYHPTSVALMLTSVCQLRCTYCYAGAGDTPTKHLSEKVAQDAILIVANNAANSPKREFTVHLHGAGEPTLRPAIISEILEYTKSLSIQYSVNSRILMSTNFCVKPDEGVWYAEALDRIFVSCDGTPDVSDVSRPMAKRSKSSGAILEAALVAVKRAGFSEKLVLRCTVTRDTQKRLCEFVRYFHEFAIKDIQFVPVSSLGRGLEVAAVEPALYIEEFRRAELLAKELGIRIHHPGTNIAQLRLDGYGCGIRGTNFAVLPDGDVSLCYEGVVPGSSLRRIFNIGSMRDGKLDVDPGRIKEIAEATHVSRRTVCSSCFCRITCAGQCAARNIMPTENIRDAPMTDACDITRALTRDAIDRLLKESNNGS